MYAFQCKSLILSDQEFPQEFFLLMDMYLLRIFLQWKSYILFHM